jgi:hypothetical protein
MDELSQFYGRASTALVCLSDFKHHLRDAFDAMIEAS